MTVKEYKEKLTELHLLIKNNPFRRGYEANIRYGKGYFNIVYKFAETFYRLTKDIQKGKLEDVTEEDKKLAKVADNCLFAHDFYGCINRSANSIYSYELMTNHDNALATIHKEEELVELCISCIHGYLETGLFNRYPFRYRGIIKWAEWDNSQNDYVVHFDERS